MRAVSTHKGRASTRSYCFPFRIKAEIRARDDALVDGSRFTRSTGESGSGYSCVLFVLADERGTVELLFSG